MTNHIQNKDTFLNHVANSLGRERIKGTVEKPVWEYQPQWKVYEGESVDDLVERLKEQCKLIHTDIIEVEKDKLQKSLQDVIFKYGGGSVVTWDDERFEEFQLNDFLKHDLENQGVQVHVWDTDLGEENVHIAAQSNIGITFSDVTLAESGTVVLFSDKGKGRSVSLLPATYIAVIPKSTIVPRMTQAAEKIEQGRQNGEQVSSCVNFISGPSNSADIEMNLIVGVHGPIKVTYIVVDDL